MANNDSQETGATEKKAKKAKKSEKPAVVTLVSVFRPIMEAGVKDRKEAVSRALEHLQSIGQKENVKGREITEAKLTTHLTAIMRDIQSERKGWWSQYEIVEEEGQLLQWRKKD